MKTFSGNFVNIHGLFKTFKRLERGQKIKISPRINSSYMIVKKFEMSGYKPLKDTVLCVSFILVLPFLTRPNTWWYNLDSRISFS